MASDEGPDQYEYIRSQSDALEHISQLQLEELIDIAQQLNKLKVDDRDLLSKIGRAVTKCKQQEKELLELKGLAKEKKRYEEAAQSPDTSTSAEAPDRMITRSYFPPVAGAEKTSKSENNVSRKAAKEAARKAMR